MDENTVEQTGKEIVHKSLCSNNPGKPSDDRINSNSPQQYTLNNAYITHDLCIEGVSHIHIGDQKNQLNLQDVTLHESKNQNDFRVNKPGAECNDDQEKCKENDLCVRQENNTISSLNRSTLDIECVEKLNDKGDILEEKALGFVKKEKSSKHNMADIEKHAQRNGEEGDKVFDDEDDVGLVLEDKLPRISSESEEIAAKARKLDTESDSRPASFELPHDILYARQILSNSEVPHRTLSTGSDLSTLSDTASIDDDSFVVGQDPCECDECLLDADPDAKPKPPPPFKKVFFM